MLAHLAWYFFGPMMLTATLLGVFIETNTWGIPVLLRDPMASVVFLALIALFGSITFLCFPGSH
jgi:hypothetical protein